jgi:hypothetical protein
MLFNIHKCPARRGRSPPLWATKKQGKIGEILSQSIPFAPPRTHEHLVCFMSRTQSVLRSQNDSVKDVLLHLFSQISAKVCASATLNSAVAVLLQLRATQEHLAWTDNY